MLSPSNLEPHRPTGKTPDIPACQCALEQEQSERIHKKLRIIDAHHPAASVSNQADITEAAPLLPASSVRVTLTSLKLRHNSQQTMDVSKEVRAVGAICAQNHWTLVIMYVQEKGTVYVDPFGASVAQAKRCERITKALVQKKSQATRVWVFETVDNPRQQDSPLVGLCCRGKELAYPVDEAGVSRMRLQIARTLVDNTEDFSEICSNCGFRCTGGTDNADIIDDGPEEDERFPEKVLSTLYHRLKQQKFHLIHCPVSSDLSLRFPPPAAPASPAKALTKPTTSWDGP
ncbi:hypothetical protein WMY93_010161 [Mugilogobius chulae]|uniref:Ubiquitin-like protease family profile domain-containing protein n=1 Tax=Mugilogobius chulae TaxID=88201 RepID=A0AAW0P6C9_9GOBI